MTDIEKVKAAYPQVSEDQIMEFKEAFSLFDKDGNGKIEAPELQSVMNHIGGRTTFYAIEDVKQMIQMVDSNADGEIDFMEFVDLMTKNYKSEMEELQDAFNIFDSDGDKQITAEEMAQTLGRLGQTISQEEIKLIMQQLDINSDGTISFDEFCQMMSYGPPKQM